MFCRSDDRCGKKTQGQTDTRTETGYNYVILCIKNNYDYFEKSVRDCTEQAGLRMNCDDRPAFLVTEAGVRHCPSLSAALPRRDWLLRGLSPVVFVIGTLVWDQTGGTAGTAGAP